MEMKKKIVAIALIFSSFSAISQTYVGFELCKKTPIEKAVEILEKSGAKNIWINRHNEKTLFSTGVEADEYPVADGKVKIKLSFTEGLLFQVYIDDESKKIKIVELMSEKYGLENITVDFLETYHYKSKDSRVSIKGGINSVQYTCGKINERRYQKVKNLERKDNTGKSL
jgi:hypothetical protein